MSGFYKMDPAKWDFGTANLSLEQEAAYLRIVNAIHKHDAPVPDNDRVLAGLFRSSTRKARALVNELLNAKKITIEDGNIWNERARSDMVHRGFVTISRAESGAKGGRTRAVNAAKILKSNNSEQAIASSRIEKNRIEKKERDKSLSLSDDFEAFWNEVPRKVSKASAMRAYAEARRKTDAATILAGMRAYAESRRGEDVRYTAHPTSWLRADRWTDEPAIRKSKTDLDAIFAQAAKQLSERPQ